MCVKSYFPNQGNTVSLFFEHAVLVDPTPPVDVKAAIQTSKAKSLGHQADSLFTDRNQLTN